MTDDIPTRRGFLLAGTGALAAATLFGTGEAEARAPAARAIALRNLHTEEAARLVYWRNGRYVPAAMRQIDRLLRDHRNGKVHRIDPALIDLLVTLQRALRSSQAFEVVSGYRSPETNAMLAAEGGGVAVQSMHLEGKAIDVRLPGRSLKALRDAAIRLEAGGVGYYPRSGFVHLDIGRVRRW